MARESPVEAPTPGHLYASARERLCGVAEELSAAEAAAPVPTCPGWTVHDVLAHLAGSCADVLAGRIEGATTDAWTAAQVAARRDRSVEELVAEWTELAPAVEELSAAFPRAVAGGWVTDVVAHEHDVRGAVHKPGARDLPGVGAALEFLVSFGLDGAIRALRLPALEVHAAGASWRAGREGTVSGAVEAPAFELFRALTGRRSEAQIKAFAWTVDPSPYLPAFAFGPFSTSSQDVVE
jgi:uncharacterized protein (TIGR03083 family)